MREVTIGLLGCGTVGQGFVHLMDRERERIRARDGVDLREKRRVVYDRIPDALCAFDSGGACHDSER